MKWYSQEPERRRIVIPYHRIEHSLFWIIEAEGTRASGLRATAAEAPASACPHLQQTAGTIHYMNLMWTNIQQKEHKSMIQVNNAALKNANINNFHFLLLLHYNYFLHKYWWLQGFIRLLQFFIWEFVIKIACLWSPRSGEGSRPALCPAWPCTPPGTSCTPAAPRLSASDSSNG